jgi:hypothetical protein
MVQRSLPKYGENYMLEFKEENYEDIRNSIGNAGCHFCYYCNYKME